MSKQRIAKTGYAQLIIREEDLIDQQRQWDKSKTRRAKLPQQKPQQKRRFAVNREEEQIPITSASDGMRWFVIACDEARDAGEYWIERITPEGKYVTNLHKKYARRSLAVEKALNERDSYQLMLEDREDQYD